MIKKTLLNDKQVALGAKMIDFAGWNMPVQYTSIVEEHKAVRESVGLFDVSHMGEIFVDGKDSLKFLNKIVPQEIGNLTDGKAVYCQLTNAKGGVIDDLIIYKLADEKYLLIVNASRVNVDFEWLMQNKDNLEVCIDNQSNNYSLLAIQGPNAYNLVKNMGLNDFPEYFYIKKTELCGRNVYVSRTGYTGEDGFEILIDNANAEFFWDKIVETGKEFNLKLIGLGARDTLRLEAALHLYGNDLDEETTPVEAGLTWSIAKNKSDDYNGKSVIMEQIANGCDKKLVGLKMIDRAIARHGYDVYFNGEKVGVITSGGVSPTLNENIALAYVKNIKEICIDAPIQVMIREKLYNAKITKRPFVEKKNTVKK